MKEHQTERRRRDLAARTGEEEQPDQLGSWLGTDTPESLAEDIRHQFPNLYRTEPSFRVHLLWYSENLIYKISFPFSPALVLRIHRRGYHSREELEGELLWMRELSEETDLLLPKVYPGKNGSYLQQLESSGGNRYTVSLISFLEGKPIGDLSSREMYLTIREIGAMTAKMHLASIRHLQREKTQPDRYPVLQRMSWDTENFFGDHAVWGTWEQNRNLTPQDREVLAEAEKRIREELDRYGRTSSHYGLIHADLHARNILQNHGQNQIIDFDDFGYGFYLYDLGCSLVTFSENLNLMVQEWDLGYESVRPLKEEDRRLMPMFVLLRRMMRIAWLSTHTDSDTARQVDSSYLPVTIQLVEKWLARTEVQPKRRRYAG